MDYDGGPTPTAIIMVWSNGITAVAYYWLTYQLIAFAFNSKVRIRHKFVLVWLVLLMCIILVFR